VFKTHTSHLGPMLRRDREFSRARCQGLIPYTSHGNRIWFLHLSTSRNSARGVWACLHPENTRVFIRERIQVRWRVLLLRLKAFVLSHEDNI
jgi:hypothetical protein